MNYFLINSDMPALTVNNLSRHKRLLRVLHDKEVN